MDKKRRLEIVSGALHDGLATPVLAAVLEQEKERLERELGCCVAPLCKCCRENCCCAQQRCNAPPPPKPEPYPTQLYEVYPRSIKYPVFKSVEVFVLEPEYTDRSRWPEWARDTRYGRYDLNGDALIKNGKLIAYIGKEAHAILFGD